VFSLFAKTWCSPIIDQCTTVATVSCRHAPYTKSGVLRPVVQILFYKQTKDHAEMTRHLNARAERGKTGKSPALSRNCKRWISQARKPASVML
jgi:hypothetical protein